MRQIVIMPGGFHPFHAGHFALYQSAKEAFPNADLYVAATNDQSERPFPFALKEKLAKLAGVEPGHFIQVKSPFQAKEITQNYNPEQDVLIFVRSEKDRNEPPKPGGTKKDGSPAYFQPWAGKNVQPFSKHAYLTYLPTVEFGPGITSATQIRKAWPTLNDKRKLALVMSLYPATQKNPKLAQNVVNMFDQVMGAQGMAQESLNEFAPSDDGDNGEEDILLKFARMWYNGDEATQQKIEQALARYGWEIGELESEEGGAFVVRAGDENGDSYIGFTVDDLTESVSEDINTGSQIIYATGPRKMGVNDVDLVFKDIKSGQTVAYVVGNNYHPGMSRLEEFAPPEGGGGGNSSGGTAEYYIFTGANAASGGTPTYIALGDPEQDNKHQVYKLGANNQKTLVSKLDWWNFLEKMIGSIMWEDDAIEAGYVDRLDNGDLVFTKQDVQESNKVYFTDPNQLIDVIYKPNMIGRETPVTKVGTIKYMHLDRLLQFLKDKHNINPNLVMWSVHKSQKNEDYLEEK